MALFGPLLWVGACAVARAMAQHVYDLQMVPALKAYRPPAAEVPVTGHPVEDPLTRVELEKYVRVWELEPGACPELPDAARWPWSWNPFHPSALLLRLRQKHEYLFRQRHLVLRQELGGGRRRYLLAPDPGAALGGRRFAVEVRQGRLERAWEGEPLSPDSAISHGGPLTAKSASSAAPAR